MPKNSTFKFRLYVAANTQNSAEAVANLKAICLYYLPDRHEIEVIDVDREPQRTLVDGINMTPSLVKLAPPPFRKIVGTLAHTKRVLLALDVTEVQATINAREVTAVNGGSVAREQLLSWPGLGAP